MKNIFKIIAIFLLHHLVWSQSNTINSYQYWVDNDFVNQQSIAVTPVSNFHLQTDLDLSAVGQGFHTFHIRFQDNNSKYSSVLSQFFFSRSLATKVTEYEYWFDNNFSAKVNVSVSPIVNLQLVTDFDCASLTNGMHILHLRFKDDGGNWSSITSNFFQKSANGTSSVNLITSYRYWLDSSYTNITMVNLLTPVNPYQLVHDFDFTQVPKGQHTFHIQFSDTSGLWSSVLTDTIVKNPLPIANFNFDANANCDSTTLLLTNESVDADMYLWDFGDGFQSTDSLPAHSYFVPGNYEISLTVTDINTGLDSTITRSIVVNGNTTNTISLSACGQQISPSGLYTWTTSGEYKDTISNSQGCDSIITVNLTVNQHSSSTINPIACNSYTAPDGQIYTQSGTFIATISNQTGCDSTISINLTIIGLDPSITQENLVLTATQANAQYQWIDCTNSNTPIIGETNQTFSPESNGNYAVIVSNNDCSDTSDCVQISNVGVHDLVSNEIQIFPNPSLKYVTIKFKSIGLFEIQLRDINGKIVYTQVHNQGEAIIDLSNLPQGIYILEMSNEKQIITQRVTKL